MSTNDEIKKIQKQKKYNVLLKLVNKILVNIGKPEIDDLTKFVDIDREDIIKECNVKSFVEMEKEFFPLFNKRSVGYYRKSGGFVLNCMRGLTKEIDMSMVKKQKGIVENINGKSYERTHMIYSIK